jgi:hypothetical protein
VCASIGRGSASSRNTWLRDSVSLEPHGYDNDPNRRLHRVSRCRQSQDWMAWIWTPWLKPSMRRAQCAVPGSRIRVLSGGSSLLRVGWSFGLTLRAHDLDLDPGKQRRHRSQRGQNRGKERERSTDHYTGCQRHFQ